MPEPTTGGTPRWVKVSATIFLVVVLLFVIVLVTRGPGGHGPSRHAAPAEALTPR